MWTLRINELQTKKLQVSQNTTFRIVTENLLMRSEHHLRIKTSVKRVKEDNAMLCKQYLLRYYRRQDETKFRHNIYIQTPFNTIRTPFNTIATEEDGIPTDFKRHSPMVHQHLLELSFSEGGIRGIQAPPIAVEELEIALNTPVTQLRSGYCSRFYSYFSRL